MFSFSIINLIIFNLLLLCLIFIFDRIRKKHRLKYSTENIKDSFLIFQKQLDIYYITNLPYTLFAVCIYISSNFLIFLLLRYLVLGKIISIQPQENLIITSQQIYYILCIFILFILSIFFFRILIQILFFKEVIKLRIYLKGFDFYSDVISYIVKPNFGQNTFTILGIICFRIASNSYYSDFFNRPFDSWYPEQIDTSEFNYTELYSNKNFEKVMQFFMYFSKKYKIISNMFYMLAYIFGHLKYHCRDSMENGFFIYNIYTLLFLTFIYDIYNKHFYYIYYVSILYYIIYMYRSYCKFEGELNSYMMFYIYRYLYENTYDYSEQRIYIKNDIYNPSKISEQNKRLKGYYECDAKKKDFEGLIYAVMNNMKNPPDHWPFMEKKFRKRKIMWLRYHLILIFILLEIFVIYDKDHYILTIFDKPISLWFTLIPVIIIFFSGIFIYRDIISYMYELDEDQAKSEEKPWYKPIFWITCIIQGYLYWFIILKPVLILMDTESLLNLVYILKIPEEIITQYPIEIAPNLLQIDLIKIEKIYSIEEKIMYFHTYLEFYIDIFDYLHDEPYLLDKEFIRDLIRQIYLEQYIDETMTIKDIQFCIKCFCREVLAFGIMTENAEELLKEILTIKEKHTMIKNIMDCVSNMINILVLWKFTITYAAVAYQIINMPNLTIAKLALFMAVKIYNVFKK